jgi:P27 family predicted phage terminase small subunit
MAAGVIWQSAQSPSRPLPPTVGQPVPNPRTPSHLKVVRGTERRDRANPAEPSLTVAPSNVRPPAWLDLSPLAHRAWHDLVPLLRGMGVLTRADRVALSLLCEALASYVTAHQIATKEGSTYETTSETGGTMIRAHPVVAMGAESVRFAKTMLGEFGLTPAARSKVSRVGTDKVDPTQTWLDGTGGTGG